MSAETPGCPGSGHLEITNHRASHEVEFSGDTRDRGNSADAGLAPAPHTLPELTEARDPAAPHVLHHDLETRSAVDLKAAGAAKYASDPTTEVVCLCYAVDDEPVQLWTRGDPVPVEFIEAARNPLWTTNAHNDAFERPITRHILEPHHGFPAVPIERRRCSMSMAYAAALPGSLEKVIEVLGPAIPERQNWPSADAPHEQAFGGRWVGRGHR